MPGKCDAYHSRQLFIVDACNVNMKNERELLTSTSRVQIADPARSVETTTHSRS